MCESETKRRDVRAAALIMKDEEGESVGGDGEHNV